MKLPRFSRFLLLAVLVSSLSALAEEATPPQPTVRSTIVRQPSPQPTPEELTRFDLDFPGGTPAEFVAAISKAMGKHINVVIPERDADVRIMPVSVRGVTVQELFVGVSASSEHNIQIVTSRSSNGQPAAIATEKAYVQFTPAFPYLTDGTVWSFKSTAPDNSEQAGAETHETPQPKVCRYFQLAPYLYNHTIEDITTAIQTGWKMAGIHPVPELSFHKETNLLIAVGLPGYIDQIPQVLDAIAQDQSFAARTVQQLQAEISKIELEKKPGWEDEVQKREGRIQSISDRVKALNTLQNPQGYFRRAKPAQ